MITASVSDKSVATRERNSERGVARGIGLPAIRYEVCGNTYGPAVVVLGGISASRHVTSNDLDASAGWWESAVGSGRAIDTNALRVIAIDYITQGVSLTDTAQQASITTFDQAQAIEAVLDALGVRTLHAIVGASYGGMIALAFAECYPTRVERIVVISAAHESDPLTTTLRSIQRRIVRLGVEAGDEREGVALARALAMTTYRTRTEFAHRFSNIPEQAGSENVFPAEKYVIARGRDYAGRTAASDFLALTLSLDLHSVTPAKISVPATLIGVREDQLVPIEKIRELHQFLGGPSELVELSSIHGHDAFLADIRMLAPSIAKALAISNPCTQPLPLLP